jgi:hypothetical protein
MNADKTTQKAQIFSTDFKILILLVLVVAIIVPPVFNVVGHYQERRQKYQNALQRVQKAGGWQNIQAASLQFFTNAQPKSYFDEEYFSWWKGERRNTNALPSALEALQPWRIQFYPDGNGVYELRLKLYGIHRTGTYSEPYYAIWVICTNVPANYVPSVKGDEAGMTKQIERKGDLIFEVR